MKQTPGIGSSREDHPSSQYAFVAGSSASPFGAVVQETVLNPEGRRGAAPPAAPVSIADESHLSKRLFPGNSDVGAPVDLDAPAGCELGHFSVEERIGSGGMGAVFRALDNRLQRVVALKVLAPSQSRDPAAVLRFQNEAQAAARLDHENIARVFYFGEDRGLHFIAFEYVTGQNVRDLIARTGRLPVPDAVNYTLQIAAALRHTAAAGVVHRDIKPSNIIIAPNGRAKLVDLGLARKLATDGAGDLTVAGTTLGTFDYISPEQARDPRNVDVRSDIYSLGCTLYHMLTGGPPYSSGTVLQKLLDHQSGQAPDPRTVNPQVPASLAAICRKMMAGDPKHRYATPDELIRDLAGVAATLGLRPLPADGYVWSRPAMPTAPKLRSGIIWAGSVAVVFLLAFLVDRMPTADRQPSAAPPDRRTVEALLPTEDEDLPPAPAPPGQTEPPIAFADQSDASSSVARSTPSEAFSVQPLPGITSPEESLATMGALPPVEVEIGGDSTRPSAPAPLTFQDFAEQAWTVGEIFRPLAERFWPDLEGATPPPPAPQVEPAEVRPEPPRWQPTKPFFIVSADYEPNVSETLAEAIANAYSGDVIELHYDGRLPEAAEPIVIDGKHITIRAGVDEQGRRYRPVIDFVGESRSASRAAMITVSGHGGAVTLQDVELRMSVTGEARNLSRQWALLSLADTEQVRLTNVAITMINPEARPAVSVVDLRPPDGVSPEEYALSGMMNDARREGFVVELDGCFVRGGTDLVTIAHTLPGRIVIRDSALAIDSDILDVTGGIEQPPAGDAIEVEFDQVTAVVGGGLLQLHLGGLPRHAAAIRMTARNSVFATNTAGSLVWTGGNASAATFDRLFAWDGRRNVFDGFSEFWSIYTDDGAVASAPTSFDLWKKRWEQSGLTDSTAVERAILPSDGFRTVWARPREAKHKNRVDVVAEDLALDRSVAPTGWLDTPDGSLIGAPTWDLPQVTNPPAGLSAADRTGPAR